MDALQQVALVELTQSVLADTDLLSLMQQAVALVASVLGVEASAWELLPDSNTLVLRAGTGWQAGEAGRASILLEPTSSVERTVLGGSPVIIADWPSETQFSQPRLLHGHGIITSVYISIGRPERFFGILSGDATQQHVWSAEEIDFLQHIANLLALGVERVQINQMIEQQVAERMRVIEEQQVAAAQDKAVLEERQRLARDLHDSMTQALYGVTLHAHAARRSLAANDVDTASNSLRALQDTAQVVLDEMRLLIFDLRPPILEQVGLSAALQERLEAVEGRANLKTTFTVDGVGNLPPLVEQGLYRIAQEALTNALKHAQAGHINVQLQQTQTHIILQIHDDGKGFDPSAARGAGERGLRGIAERVQQLGGSYTLRSVPGDGTELRVEIPL